jgi:hypothetical protein
MDPCKPNGRMDSCKPKLDTKREKPAFITTWRMEPSVQKEGK